MHSINMFYYFKAPRLDVTDFTVGSIHVMRQFVISIQIKLAV